MTREEIMQLNTDYLNGCESEHKMNELFSYVLSQESCTDAVSRQAVLKEFEKGTENLYGRIDKLPSVNSQPCDDAISRNAVLEKAVYTETEEGWCGYTVDVDYIKSLPSVTPSHNKHCKDCKYFELDHWAEINGVPVICAHEICTKWCSGVKTSSDGYCHLFAEMESEE